MSTTSVFLTPAAFVSPAAFADAFVQAVKIHGVDLAAVHVEFAAVVAGTGAESQLPVHFGEQIQALTAFRSERVGVEALFKTTAADVLRGQNLVKGAAAVLGEVPQEALDRAREAIFPTALAPYEPPPVSVRVGGEPAEVPGAKVPVFKVVADESQRVAVANGTDERRTAIEYISTAVERSLPDFLAEHTALLDAHIRAVISGEIAAPEALREQVVRWVAQSPGHAAAYAEKVLQDALLAGRLAAPVPVVPDPSGLTVREMPHVERGPAAQRRAQPSVFGFDSIRNGIHALRALLMSGDTQVRDAMSALGVDNPAAFSGRALTQLENAAIVMLYARRIRSKAERRRYLYEACKAGLIPAEYLSMARDRREIRLAMPATEGAGVPPVWQDPIGSFIQGDSFRDAVMKIEAPNSVVRARELLKDLSVAGRYLSVNIDRSLSDIRALIDAGRIDEARMAMVRVRAYLLTRTYKVRLNEDGLTQMDVFSGREWQAFLERDSLSTAEAVLDFALDWAHKAVRLSDSMYELSQRLELAGEEKASSDIMSITREYLRVGDLDAITRLYWHVREKLTGLEERMRVQEAALFGHIHAALLTILEAARSLGALPDAEARRTLAEKVPPVVVLLGEDGPGTEKQARRLLKKSGIPLPGAPDIAALDTPLTRGLGLPPPEAGQAGVFGQRPSNGDGGRAN